MVIDITLATLVCLVFTLIPRIALGACYVFMHLPDAPYMVIVLLPLFVVVDFFIWMMAYNRVYRPKKV